MKQNIVVYLFFLICLPLIFGKVIFADDVFVSYRGRYLNRNNTKVFDWSNTQIKAIFDKLTSLSLLIEDSGNYFNVFVDDKNHIIQTKSNVTLYPISYNLVGDQHVVPITKRT